MAWHGKGDDYEREWELAPELNRDGTKKIAEPRFDQHGYPDDRTLFELEWRRRDPAAWLNYAKAAWNQHYGKVDVKDGRFHFATGGWSGNESVIEAMRKNTLWALLWDSSHRGGLHVLRAPTPPVERVEILNGFVVFNHPDLPDPRP